MSLQDHIESLIPSAWGELIATIRHRCPGAVIAGGCLRDVAFGGVVKDIDVFVPQGPRDNIGLWNALGHPTNVIHAGYMGGIRSEVLEISEYRNTRYGLPIQVIDVTYENDSTFIPAILQRMDFDACQIAWDGLVLHTTAAFETALRTQKWSVVNAEDDVQATRSLKRAARFAERYPHITINTELAERQVIPGL